MKKKIMKKKKTLANAYKWVYERRNMILPGKGFFIELMALDRKIHRNNSMGLKEYYAYTVQNRVKEIYQKDVSYEDCLSKLGETGYNTDNEILQAISSFIM